MSESCLVRTEQLSWAYSFYPSHYLWISYRTPSLEYILILSESMAPRAPSTSLLRFLRSQVETCYFTSNLQNSCRASSLPLSTKKPPSRLFTTTPPCTAVVESSLFPLDVLTPKSLLPKPRPLHSPTHSRPLPPTASNNTRSASSDSRPWNKRLAFLKLKSGAKHGDAEGNGASLPSFLSDPGGGVGIGRTTAAKASDGLKLRCTEFDGDGNVTLVHGEFKKSELIAMVCSFSGWDKKK